MTGALEERLLILAEEELPVTKPIALTFALTLTVASIASAAAQQGPPPAPPAWQAPDRAAPGAAQRMAPPPAGALTYYGEPSIEYQQQRSANGQIGPDGQPSTYGQPFGAYGASPSAPGLPNANGLPSASGLPAVPGQPSLGPIGADGQPSSASSAYAPPTTYGQWAPSGYARPFSGIYRGTAADPGIAGWPRQPRAGGGG